MNNVVYNDSDKNIVVYNDLDKKVHAIQTTDTISLIKKRLSMI